jgi:hypothetical protein
VDAKEKPPYWFNRDDPDRLSPEEAMEVLLHRHFILTDKPHDDLFPYYEKATMRMA